MNRLIRAVIDTHALRHNLRTIRERARGARVMAVVKANAYGHGLIPTALALAELVTDKLPMTPSRKVPMQFGARILMGALCGAAIATPGGGLLPGLCLGAVGAVIGTLC